MGRLHTRYSPVRRSPPMCCHTVLPLDLHVLSLSLAFILSQDQTLRCSNCFLFILSPDSVSHRSPRSSHWRYSLSIYSIPILVLLVVLCKYPQRSLFAIIVVSRLRVQKYTYFLFRQTFRRVFFKDFLFPANMYIMFARENEVYFERKTDFRR